MNNEQNIKFNKKIFSDYYLGLDIGTDSVGYAVTDMNYKLLKYKGNPMWGSHIFENGKYAEERRNFRSARRRLDRRQTRVALIGELFAEEINKIDPQFFIRRKESYMFREDKEDSFKIFNDDIQNKEYYKKYPTIHHLIYDLMNTNTERDVRLVYWACAWLVAHRGHFLSEVSKENIEGVLSFSEVYNNFINFLKREEKGLLWSEDISENDISEVLKKNINISQKVKELSSVLYQGEKVPKKTDENYLYSCEGIIKLLCGGKYSAQDLFKNDEYSDVSSIILGADDEDISKIINEISEDDGELLLYLKGIYDWSKLVEVLDGKKSISEAKIEVYNQHREDLKVLKGFIKKYSKNNYNKIFRDENEPNNYVLYSKNIKGNHSDKIKFANKEDFSQFLLNILNKITPDEADKKTYNEMIEKIQMRKFLQKQKDNDNRVIPYQLYWYELDRILKNAEKYLPFLNNQDENGLTISDKIRSVFEFKVPYYVGPLCDYKSKNAWIKRKAEGKIYPWNFDEMVDRDKSEQEFINRMTNTCSYYPGKDVLPYNSLCYSSFMVLNEINKIKIDDKEIPVALKQEIYKNLFLKNSKVTVKKLKDYLLSNGYITRESRISGIDTESGIKSNLKPYISFRNLIENGKITEKQVEEIIARATYSEDKQRFSDWLMSHYPSLSLNDVKYIKQLKINEFGRLSKDFLCELQGVDKQAGTGALVSIMECLWNTNCNLMEILSDRYTFKEELQRIKEDYYESNQKTINERLDDMYISNGAKRPIIRTLDIVKEVIKVTGKRPKKIFVEMARDNNGKNSKKRTKTRCQQITELYSKLEVEEVRELKKQLEDMGEKVDNILQRNQMFLYFMQLGKCLYTMRPIDLDSLIRGEGKYNIEHIYPRKLVKDDSIINNEILVESEVNGEKSDVYPINNEIQNKMYGYWKYLKDMGLISDEKFRRLTRKTAFTDEEKLNFINRQLVETRQSTKAIANILNEMYPESEVVYVKAGLVSEFRQEYNMVKSRIVNDLHHAKDAYLNVVVGNVYNCKFSKKWFNVNSEYSLNTDKIFKYPVKLGNEIIWNGEKKIGEIKKVVSSNAVHYTKYSFCRKGGFFDQLPITKKEGLVPLKKNIPTEIYGGYNKPAASFFALVKYCVKNKSEIMVMPVELLHSDNFLNDNEYALNYAKKTVETIINKSITSVEILLNKRIIKVNTVLSLDGFKVCVSGKSHGGKTLLLSPLISLKVCEKNYNYIKKLESFVNKLEKNKNIRLDSEHDQITKENNIELYDYFIDKFSKEPYKHRPNNPLQVLKNSRDNFINIDTKDQVVMLTNILGLLGRVKNADLKIIGGSKFTGDASLSAFISNWRKSYNDVRIIDMSPSGLYEKATGNLLGLL